MLTSWSENVNRILLRIGLVTKLSSSWADSVPHAILKVWSVTTIGSSVINIFLVSPKFSPKY